MQARNAYFNLNRLGVVVDTYADNFYGVDYNADPQQAIEHRPGLQSDRLFGNWYLTSSRVESLSRGEAANNLGEPAGTIAIPAEWSTVIRTDVKRARAEQERVRSEFKSAFNEGLICAAFQRGDETSHYLLFAREDVE
jgi:predicted GNAT superfamily acetyltransferase